MNAFYDLVEEIKGLLPAVKAEDDVKGAPVESQ